MCVFVHMCGQYLCPIWFSPNDVRTHSVCVSVQALSYCLLDGDYLNDLREPWLFTISESPTPSTNIQQINKIARNHLQSKPQYFCWVIRIIWQMKFTVIIDELKPIKFARIKWPSGAESSALCNLCAIWLVLSFRWTTKLVHGTNRNISDFLLEGRSHFCLFLLLLPPSSEFFFNHFTCSNAHQRENSFTRCIYCER